MADVKVSHKGVGKQATKNRFYEKSASKNPLLIARVAKLVDARDLKSLGLAAVPVRVRPRAPALTTS